MLPIPEDVVAFLGRTGDASTLELARERLPMVTAMIDANKRGKGFTDGVPDDDVAAVIVSSVARLVVNSTQIESETAGPFTTRYHIFDGWTLPELAVLHRHRKRAA